MKRLPVLVAAVALAACAHNPPVSVQAAESCPPVPKCEAYPPEEIATNADMVRALIAYRSAFEQCRLYRDALSACLKGDEEGKTTP